MKIINVQFINFWPGFDELDWFNHWKNTYHHPQINWISDSNTKLDLIVSSVFGSIEKIQQYNCKKLLYVRENLQHSHYFQYLSQLHLFDLVIGFNDQDNQIDIPWYYELFNLYKLDCNKSYIPQNMHRKNLCLISRNPHHLRLSLLDSFVSKNFVVDCPSIVGKNMNIIVDDKLNFIQNFYFNICPENRYANGYTTEKLFDCCISGCVPIYYGCEGLNDGFYNKDRILHIKKDLSNYDQIVDRTLYLLNHKNELIEFMNQNPFAINYQDYISNIKQKIHNSLEQLLLN